MQHSRSTTLKEQMADASAKKFVNAKECAARYSISQRTWFRLVDSGRAPQPTRFGRLARWALSSLEVWESANCQSLRKSQEKKR